MAQEFFDVVDRHDQPTGQLTTKKQAHLDATPHRVAAVYVFHPDGRLYVQVHENSGGLLDHTVGGHVIAGETYEQAAKREMQEEIGLHSDVTPVASAVLEDSQAAGRNEIIHLFGIFVTQAPDGWEFTPNDEVKELRLMSVEDIARDMEAKPFLYTYGFITTMKSYLYYAKRKADVLH